MGNIKAINFDLDTKKLKKYYPGKNYRQAYRDIRKFMINNGFFRRQWSGYTSKYKLSNSDIQRFATKLSKTFPWLKECVNKFDVTDVGKQLDLTHIIKGETNTKVQKIEKQVETQKSAYMPRSKLEAQAHKLHNAQRNTPTKTKSNEIE